ncbi:MAG: DsbA family protein [Parvibaculales bacterium]
MSEGELSKFIGQYLLDNPAVLIDALDNAQRFSIEERERKKIETLKRNSSAIFNDKRDFSIGPADAKITVVEFFDYNCGYCKRALPDLLKLVEKNDDIRVTFKEMPILGPSSTAAAQMALTAQSEEDYLAIHRDILENRGQLNQARIDQIADKYGLNDAVSKDRRRSPLITKHLDDTRALAQSLEITGTPSFIINDRILPGAVPYDRLQAEIDDIRKALN